MSYLLSSRFSPFTPFSTLSAPPPAFTLSPRPPTAISFVETPFTPTTAHLFASVPPCTMIVISEACHFVHRLCCFDAGDQKSDTVIVSSCVCIRRVMLLGFIFIDVMRSRS